MSVNTGGKLYIRTPPLLLIIIIYYIITHDINCIFLICHSNIQRVKSRK